jgi:uncharacterized protein YndB with AHSA1/START domain
VIKKILAVLVLGVLGLFGYASTKPDTFEVVRSATIKAPPEKIYARLNDFSQWDSWSPWSKLDPAMTKKISTNSVGKGATYEWAGNSDVGKGKMEIVESVAPSAVKMSLYFAEPFNSNNSSNFSLVSLGDSTKVEWRVKGQSPFISKVMTVFFDMDKEIGKDFERGLENLRKVSE